MWFYCEINKCIIMVPQMSVRCSVCSVFQFNRRVINDWWERADPGVNHERGRGHRALTSTTHFNTQVSTQNKIWPELKNNNNNITWSWTSAVLTETWLPLSVLHLLITLTWGENNNPVMLDRTGSDLTSQVKGRLMFTSLKWVSFPFKPLRWQ